MEDFVTYEQAVKLKELGFDGKCNHFYCQPTGKELKLIGYIPMDFIDPLYHDFNNPATWSDNSDETFSAPTLSQTQKWLREIKESDILIDKENNFYIGVFWNPFMKTYQSIEKFSISGSDNFVSEIGMYDFDTYEDCLSKGITQLLNLLTYKTEKK